MRVLIVNTSELTGGAAIAANRLCESLNNNGVKAKMLVRDRQSDDVKVVSLPSSLMNRVRFVWERAEIFLANHLSKQNLWAIDTGSQGVDITSLREFREADVIHLHWVNQGFLSLKSLKKIFASGKPVVWTMHDMWPCTSICHHAGECQGYESHCHDCPLLKSPGRHDLSYRVFDRKQQMLSGSLQGGTMNGSPLFFVTCSHWLEGQAHKSALLCGQHITCIPNALDTHIFYPGNQVDARKQLNLPLDKKLLLFGSLKVTDKRKGIDYLVEAARIMHEQYPNLRDNLGFVVMGQQSDQLQSLLPFPVYSMGYISAYQHLAQIYRAVDAFVTPSLFENLPNTIAESMACGTPCVGFHVGGIPEMITHTMDGYVAEYKNSDDLARGIDYVLDHPELGAEAAHHAHATYNESHVAQQYIHIYERCAHPMQNER